MHCHEHLQNSHMISYDKPSILDIYFSLMVWHHLISKEWGVHYLCKKWGLQFLQRRVVSYDTGEIYVTCIAKHDSCEVGVNHLYLSKKCHHILEVSSSTTERFFSVMVRRSWKSVRQKSITGYQFWMHPLHKAYALMKFGIRTEDILHLAQK